MSSLETRDTALHIARIAVAVTVLFASASHSRPIAVFASAALFLAAFSLTHDLWHGALRLPRRLNEIAFTLSGLLMLVSGHGMRVTHLRHHGRPLADDDLEGAGARLSPLAAILTGPSNALALRVSAFRSANARGRLLQIAETMAGFAIVGAAWVLGSRALLVHVVVALVLQCTMGFWASHVPHNAPPWLIRLAERLAFTRSPIILSLAYHELHHRNPRIGCQRLAADR